MSNSINDLAIVQDQFQLMAMSVEIEDENAARFNNNLVAMFNEMKKNINTLSDRILVFEQKEVIYKENVEVLTKTHLEKEEAQANKIAQLTLRLDESRENQKSQAQEIFDLQEQLDIVRQAYNGHTHSTHLTVPYGYTCVSLENSTKSSNGPSTPIKHLDIVRKEREEAVALEKKKEKK